MDKVGFVSVYACIVKIKTLLEVLIFHMTVTMQRLLMESIKIFIFSGGMKNKTQLCILL